jgi:hypothetical protein
VTAPLPPIGQVASEDSTTADFLNIGASPSRASPGPGAKAGPSKPPAPVHPAPDADPFGLFADAPPVNPAPMHAAQHHAPRPPQQAPGPQATPDLLNFDAFASGGGAGPPRPGPGMQPRGPMPGRPMQPNVRPPFQNPNSGWSQF